MNFVVQDTVVHSATGCYQRLPPDEKKAAVAMVKPLWALLAVESAIQLGILLAKFAAGVVRDTTCIVVFLALVAAAFSPESIVTSLEALPKQDPLMLSRILGQTAQDILFLSIVWSVALRLPGMSLGRVTGPFYRALDSRAFALMKVKRASEHES